MTEPDAWTILRDVMRELVCGIKDAQFALDQVHTLTQHRYHEGQRVAYQKTLTYIREQVERAHHE